MKVYQSAHTDIAVKDLKAILLANIDSWFLPANEDGKVTYLYRKGRCWISQPLYCPASFPFCCIILGSPSQRSSSWQKKKQFIMLPNQYEDLKRDVIDHMIALVYENKEGEEQDNDNKGTN